MDKIITNGDAGKFQIRFTAFLQEHLSQFCVPQHQEKVYQALSFMLIYSLFADGRYDVRMEQDDGHGRSDITAHPRTQGCPLSLVFEIKKVSAHWKKGGKRGLKSMDRLKAELEGATVVALKQIETRQYRARAPLHTTRIHEYGLAFAGKFCAAAVRTFHRDDGASGWREVNHDSAVIPDHIPDVEEDDEDDEDMDVDDEM